MRLQIKVIPNSSQDKIVGWLGARLKVKVRAQPVKGRATLAVLSFLSHQLEIDSGEIEIIRGQGSTNKILEVSSLCESEVLRRIEKSLTT